jgi:hypothetical protein
VLMHTAYNFTDNVWYCLLAGADGYPHKCTGCAELLDAARRAAAGEGVWDLGKRIEELQSCGVATSRGDRLTPKSARSWF